MRYVIVLLTLLLSGCTMTMEWPNSDSEEIQAAKDRIKTYEVIKKEQQLTHDILKLKLAIEQIKATAQKNVNIPGTNLKGEYIPEEELPPEVKAME